MPVPFGDRSAWDKLTTKEVNGLHALPLYQFVWDSRGSSAQWRIYAKDLPMMRPFVLYDRQWDVI